jgi:rhodanese-related sulfurtransferase
MSKFKFILNPLLILMVFAGRGQAQQTILNVSEFEKAIQQQNIQLLDVRTPGEYQSGHLKNSMLADWNNQAEFQDRVKALDKNKPVYTYCLSGIRSKAATQWLRENGFNAFTLSGGINAWKQADKPFEQMISVPQISMQEYLSKIPSNKTVLVDFGAVWCPPCRKMAPILDSLAAKYPTRFVLVKIDGGEQSSICKEMNIGGFPTLILYKKGREVWRNQGLVEATTLIQKF